MLTEDVQRILSNSPRGGPHMLRDALRLSYATDQVADMKVYRNEDNWPKLLVFRNPFRGIWQAISPAIHFTVKRTDDPNDPAGLVFAAVEGGVIPRGMLHEIGDHPRQLYVITRPMVAADLHFDLDHNLMYRVAIWTIEHDPEGIWPELKQL